MEANFKDIMDNTTPRETHNKSLDRSFEGTKSARVLVVDDNVDLLKLISIRLKPMQFELKTVLSGEEALSVMALWRPDLVITDLQMPGISGMELFKQIQSNDPLIPVIILTAHGTIPDAVDATQSGVSSYLTKPFDSKSLVKQIQSALKSSGFQPKNKDQSSTTLLHNNKWREDIITQSPIMESLLEQLKRLADLDNLIRFVGEPGVGKDLLAHAVHAAGKRSNKPLTHLAGTSIPTRLLELEFFGRIGNGSIDEPEQKGLLQRAHQGTLLLNDYNVASSNLLRKVLHAIINKKASPIDSDQTYPSDVLFLTTSSVSVIGMSTNQTIFDLAENLGMIEVWVPPLRKRREDIPLLIKHALLKHADGKQIQFSNKAMRYLLAANWKGNVRQLINVVTQCAQLSKTKIISEAMVKSRLQSRAYTFEPLTAAHRKFERNYLIEILKVTNGNVTKAADMAKRNRTEFHRLLKKHKIEAKTFRQ